MRSLDTNIVLRLLLNDVPGQSMAVRNMIDQSKHNSLALADAVFFECAWVLSGSFYSFDRQTVGQMLLYLTTIDQINCNRALFVRAIPLYVQHKDISFIDACLAIYADLNDATPLLTYDQRLAKTLPQLVSNRL